jgi:peptidoglycan/LPS O-acetylase OafA/YrhL
MASTSTQYRPEIDGLRAVAVLLVVFNHALVGPFSGGFIGVDVFFVISGFLITSIIVREFDTGTFGYRRFIERRARRIIPALYALLLPISIAAYFLLLEPDRAAYMRSLISTVTFWSNIRFFLDTGYFDIAATYKPLLHTWSLGIEEQFYVVFPIFLIILLKISVLGRFTWLLLAVVTSFVLQMTAGSTAAFYLLPHRAWELLAGAAASLFAISELGGSITKRLNTNVVVKHILPGFCLVLIFATAVLIRKESVWPTEIIFVPVLATAVLLVFTTPDSIIGKLLALRPLVIVGLCSYSIYLWHYPIFSLVRYRTIGDIDLRLAVVLIVISLILGWVSWRVVERPFRVPDSVSGTQVAMFSLMGGVLLFAGGVLFAGNDRLTPLVQQTASIGPSTQVVLIGDSHAEHLVSGLMPFFPIELEYSTSAGCVPLRDVDRYDFRFVPGECASFIGMALDSVIAEPQVGVVVLASMGPVYLTGEPFRGTWPERVTGDGLVLTDQPEISDRWTVFELGMRRTFHELRRAGKSVVFIVDVPELGIEPQFCDLSKPETCQNSRVEIDRRIGEYRRLVRDVVKDFANVTLFDPTELFCDESVCHGIRDGQALYRDFDHLSLFGSSLVGDQLGPVILQLLARQ